MRTALQHWIPLAIVPLLTVGCFVGTVCTAETNTSESKVSADELAKNLQLLIDQHRGDVAVMVRHLPSGRTFKHHESQVMPTASLIKLPLMLATYKKIHEGNAAIDDRITLKESDKVPGSGILTGHFSAGLELSLKDAMHLMIAYSDNTATNLVIDRVGLNTTNELMKDLGCDATRLNSKVYRRDTSNALERSKKYGLGSTSCVDMIRLLTLLERAEFLNQEMSENIVAHLLACQSTSGIPRHLPKGTKVAHKTGSVGNTRAEAGIVYSPAGPIAICVLTTENADKSWSDENEAQLLTSEIANVAYSHFVGDNHAEPVQVARNLKIGASGELVESLQRTLNKRVTPSPDLSIDGDFGPNTETAVIAFQEQVELKTNGVVDREMWAKLGPLVTEAQAAPSPQQVVEKNSTKLPPEQLRGPPVVTCKAWCFVDGETGEQLAGEKVHTKRDPASITKIMTAHLVLKHAEQHPEVLQEIVTFSKRADDTSGSTAAVRAGEQLPVSELLYGLMLPSGNDASVALAEFFGSRIRADQEGSSYDRFITEMNNEAARLGMKDTGYKNPHGLTAEGHVTTAWDMTLLARAAMEHSKLREIVSTRQRVCTLQSLVGYERQVVWNNTNRLLGHEGYIGVKTGTTGPAGACLVAGGVRDGREMFGVILGSSCSDARYSDMRNLFRYVWSSHQESPEPLQDTAAAAAR